MIRYLAYLSLFSFVVLSAAAVWLGALNQDEGWYLYAAGLVGEGKMLYRDFFYTQGPLLPLVYSTFSFFWENWGLLGGRILTWMFGALSIVFAVAYARRLVSPEHRAAAGLIAFLLLGSNLYHLYYLSIPKTYALGAFFTAMGFYNLTFAGGRSRRSAFAAFVSGAALAFACGARVSLAVMPSLVALYLLVSRRWRVFFPFAGGGALAFGLVYGAFLFDPQALEGLIAAQRYHAGRGGFDAVFTVGSISRLTRWYLPVFVLLGMGCICGSVRKVSLPLACFAAVFLLQMFAPFPYEDYQVPIMGVLAVAAAATFSECAFADAKMKTLLALGLAFACSFGSPLLEKWMTNGQDRFWSIKKEKCELQQLRDVAKRIEAADPGGRELFTQDLYLAIETGRKVPQGLEMGPFSMLTDAQWMKLIASQNCKVAALSGYSFAIDPPKCDEVPVARQLKYWELLKRRYRLVDKEEYFGQNQTTLLVLKLKEDAR